MLRIMAHITSAVAPIGFVLLFIGLVLLHQDKLTDVLEAPFQIMSVFDKIR